MLVALKTTSSQQDRRSFTEKVFTQEIKNKEKTIDQRSRALSTKSRRWLIVSASILLVQHRSTMMIFRFWWLSILLSLQWAVVHTKKANFLDTSIFQIALQGKTPLWSPFRVPWRDITAKICFLDNTQYILGQALPWDMSKECLRKYVISSASFNGFTCITWLAFCCGRSTSHLC